MATTATSAPTSIQGVAVPALTVDPQTFFLATRRQRFPMRSLTNIAGIGSSDTVQLVQEGVVAGLEVRVTGTVTFGGTITGTTMSYDWPFNLVQNFQLSANGQSNLISCRGLSVRALEFMRNPRLDDSGVSGTFGSTAVTTGTLKLPTDNWGTVSTNNLNPGATVPAIGAYVVDLTYFVPVTQEDQFLTGAIFAQSTATNLTLTSQWATQAQICTLGGSATFASSLQWSVTGLVYSIPNVGGRFVVPDLSVYHQVAENRQSGLGQGGNQLQLVGSGAGRKLTRAWVNTYSGATPAPLAVTDANYNNIDWAYGGSTVPEAYASGTSMRAKNIREFGVDLGGNWGIAAWDFVNSNSLRDVVDESATNNLRLDIGLVNAPTSGYAQVVQEVLFAAAAGA